MVDDHLATTSRMCPSHFGIQRTTEALGAVLDSRDTMDSCFDMIRQWIRDLLTDLLPNPTGAICSQCGHLTATQNSSQPGIGAHNSLPVGNDGTAAVDMTEGSANPERATERADESGSSGCQQSTADNLKAVLTPATDVPEGAARRHRT